MEIILGAKDTRILSYSVLNQTLITQEEQAMHRITLIPGDGIGPEIAYAARRVLDASGAALHWDEQQAGAAQIEACGTPLPQTTLDSIRTNGIALKGPVTTPIGTGFRSVNVALRQAFDLYANVRPTQTYAGVPSRYENINIIIFRENTEDLYAGVEHMVGQDAAESIKIITRAGCERIVRYAFAYARQQGRKKMCAVHKANIMKCTDGLFLDVARSIAQEYPDIAFEDMIIDAMCMRLVQSPEDFDCIVTLNLYGDILSDLCAGLTGGLGLAPGANIGKDVAVFEAIHGSAPQIAGKDIANPSALILSGVMMLRHIGEMIAAERVEKAVYALIAKGANVTADLGGDLGTQAFADAVIAQMNR